MLGCNRRSNIFNYFILFIFGLFLSASASSSDLEVEEYSVTSLFTVEKLGEFLNTEGVVQKDREGYIYITAPDYSSSILRWEGDYFYYANIYPTKSLNTVAKAIFREHSLKGWFSYGKGIFRIKMLASPDQEKTKYPAVPSVLAAINDGLDYENHHNISHFIVKEGSLELIKYFLTEKKLDPNVQDSEGLTPLMLALQDGKDEIAQEFINLNNIDFEIEDNEGKTVLMIAKEFGRTKIAKEIRRKIYKRQGWNDLMIAVEDNDVSVVIDLLARNDIDLFLRNDAGETALMIAERLGYVEIVGRIQNKIYKVKGWTDLMIAASKNDFFWVRSLLVRGDDSLVRDKDGQNAFMIAKKLGFADVADEIKNFICESKDWTELMVAVEVNDVEMVRDVLSKDDTDPTIRNKNGKTALNMAKKDSKIAKEIKKGIFAKKGWDDLMIAVDDNDLEAVKDLAAREDIDLRRENKDGKTALMMAKEYGYDEIAEEIQKNIYKKEGWTDLMIAADKGDLELVKALLAKGDVDLKAKNKLGKDAREIAKEKDLDDIVEEIQNNIYKNDIYTDLMIAVAKKDIDSVRSILANDDLDPNVKNKNGEAAYEIALDLRCDDIKKEIASHKNFKDPNRFNGKLLKMAIDVGDFDFVREMLEDERFDFNANDGLMVLAIEKEVMGLATEIINKKSYNPNVKSGEYGLTDLMHALKEKRFDLAMGIINHDNFDPNAKNESGQSPLLYAIWEKQEKIAKAIIAHKKFDPKVHINGFFEKSVDSKGLKYLMEKGLPGVVKEFVRHKDFDSGDSGVFRIALDNKQFDVALEIVKHKNFNPNFNKNDKCWNIYKNGSSDGWTDLMLVLVHGRVDFAREIIKKEGFDPNIKNSDGWSALNFAMHGRYNDIAKEILQHERFDFEDGDEL